MEDRIMSKTMNDLAEIVYQNCSRDHIENCVIEEMSELIKAVSKSRRCEVDLENMNNESLCIVGNMAEETGHVLLMCIALMKSYGIQDYQVKLEANDAVNRMLKAKQERI
jgi:NTP pyrophosphatase (non-canonical NTP hydrolase)